MFFLFDRATATIYKSSKIYSKLCSNVLQSTSLRPISLLYFQDKKRQTTRFKNLILNLIFADEVVIRKRRNHICSRGYLKITISIVLWYVMRINPVSNFTIPNKYSTVHHTQSSQVSVLVGHYS